MPFLRLLYVRAVTWATGVTLQARYDMVYNTEGGMAIKKAAAERGYRDDSKRVKLE